MLDMDAALELASEMYESKRFLGKQYDWKADAIALIEADAFTAAQVGLLLNLSPSYVTRTLSKILGTTKDRTRGGVAGKFNPESLTLLRFVRAKWSGHPDRRKINDHMRGQIKELIEAGNGLSLLSHLTGVPRPTLAKIKGEAISVE